MQVYGLRVFVVLASLVLVLGLLLGGQALYARRTVDAPLHTLYHNDPAVISSTVTADDRGWTIRLKMKDVTDLHTAYQRLYDGTQAILGHTRFQLILLDTRNASLETALEQLQPALQEGLATGRFTNMVTAVSDKARQLGVATKVYVDDRNVYVQMQEGDRYLYEVLPRPPKEAR